MPRAGDWLRIYTIDPPGARTRHARTPPTRTPTRARGRVERFCTTMSECGTADQVVDVAEKVVTIQRDYGDRVDRKFARFKYTIANRGLTWFRQELEHRLGYRLGSPRRFEFTDNGDRYGWGDGENGTSYFTLFIQSGRVKDTAE